MKITYEIEPGTEAINDDYGNGYYYEFSKNDFNPFDISIVYADGTQTSYTTDKLMNGRLYLPEGKDGSDTVKVIASADELFAGNSLEFKYGTYRLLDTLKPVSTANYTVHFESDLIQKDSSKTLKVSDPEKIPLSSSIFGSMIFSKEIYRPGEEFTNNFFLTTNYAANLGVYYFIMPEGMDYTDIAWSPDPVSDLSDLPDIHNYLTDLGYVGENGEKVLKVDLSSLYSDKFVANSMILYMNKISLTMKVNEDALPINKLLDARDVSFLAVTDTYPLLADEIPVYKQFGSEKIEGHSSRDRGRAIPYSIVLPSFVGVKNGIDDPMTEKQEFLAFDSSIPEETTAHFNSGKTFKTEDDLIDSHIRLTSINGMAGSLSTTQNILILPTIEAGDPFTMVLTGAGILSDNLSTDTSKVLYSSDIVTVDGNKIIDTSDFLTANQVTNWSTIRTVILSCEELNEGEYTSVILPVQVLNINQVEKDSEAMIKTDFLFNSAGKVLSTSSNLKAKVTVSDAVFTNGITIIDVKTNQSPIIIDNREQGSLVRSLNTMVLQNIDGTIDKTVDELLTHSIEQASLKFNQTVNLWSKVFLPTLQKITNQKPEFNDFSYAVAPEFIAQWNKDIVLDKQTYEKLPETFEIPLIAQNDQIALHYTDGDGHELAETDWFKREHNTPMMISDVTEKISNGTLQKIIVDINEGKSSNLLESKFESNHDTEFVFGDVIPEENGYVVYDLFDQTITTGHYSIDGTRVGGQTISIPTIVKEIKQLILESDTGGRYANLSDEQLTELIQRTYTNLLDLIYSPFLLHPEGFVTQQLTSVEEKLGLKLTISEYFPEEFAENPEAAFTEMEQVMKFRFSQLRNFVGLLNSYQVTYVYTTSLIDEGTKHYEITVTESEASKARAELEVLKAENEAKGIHTTVQLNVLPNEAPLVELATVLGEGTKHYEITVTESEASKARAELEALKAENEAKGIHTTVQLNVLPNEAPLVELATVLGEGTKHYENTVTESEASKARAELEALKAENEAKGIHTTVQLNVLPNEAPSKITVIPEKPTKQKETTSVPEPVRNTVTLKKDNLVLLVAPEKGDSMAIKDVIVPMQNTTNGASKLPQTGETKSATGFITGLGILLTFGSALIFKKKHE
ncbi:LPXTG cell wall anchor domain-containing protein [Enterococcus dongliensis]|uniref:LPXTG cell wall anchor domain-containing protein n=1 Tax=Enterococcus dongliensis TaxID=2559925 RepID=UPI0028911ED1|nr:LPXTG cell wall anchor domain-containing protein [Enterococcus dongliensis]MDT2605027.1 LPXTG cell wall anchor domain-containing protein [Enterococcus dongliensis]MDT2646181.1 LPXTG cell wall anchor domain-containing protein [Enterococcus dongliensis]MDT2672702.1 LPXTG cell wall anchor domain-containing protein [Enterococcus dongliensis]